MYHPNLIPTGLRVLGSLNSVPLKSISVEVDIKGFVANVTAVLTYKNPEQNTIEGVYKFPVDEGGAVYRFEAEVDGRVIIAECQERKQAEHTYQEAITSGHTAALMQEANFSRDIFSITVGNIPPDGEVKITFGYVIELRLLAESGVAQFTLCTVLNPRYNPAPESGGVANPPTVPYINDVKQPYDINFKAKVGNSAPISNIVSTKDDLKVEYNADRTEAGVSLGKPFIADHDLTLDISYSEPFKPHAVIEKGVPTEEGLLKEDLVMLGFLPELNDSDYTTNHEFIIVIDRSGSMEGAKIKSAQETLLLFLKSLPMGCYFNIIGFGSNFDKLFPDGSKELSEESMKAAMEYQNQLAANMGGTEILQPLTDIYGKPAMSSHTRQLFVLTDGEVTNSDQVISIVHKNALHTRVFAFGIGEGASTALVKGIARAGRGRAEFIKEGDRMQQSVMKTLKAAMQLGITDLQLDWNLKDSPELIQIPKVLPPLFSGDRLIVYAVSSGQSVLDGKVHLKGKIGERELNFGLDVHSGQVKSSEDRSLPLHRLAAKAQILQLQDDEHDNAEMNKSAIILFSTAANIISHHTAMVAVDKEKSAKLTGHRTVFEVPHLLAPKHRSFSSTLHRTNFVTMDNRSNYLYSQPMYQSQHWNHSVSSHSFRRCSTSARSCLANSASNVYRNHAVPAVESMGQYSTPAIFSASSESSGLSVHSYPSIFSALSESSGLSVQKVVTDYLAVVKLQTFAGSWKLDSNLERVLEVNLQKIKSSQPQMISDEVWGTVLAVAILNIKYSDNKDEWEMIEMKAQQWLNTQQLHNHSLISLLDLAKAAVSN